MPDTQLQIAITALNNATGELQKLGSDLEGLQGGANNVTSSFGSMAGAIAVGQAAFAAFQAVAMQAWDGLKNIVAQGSEAQHTVAMLDAEIAKLGASTPITQSEADKLAESLSQVSRFSKDTVQQAESIALKFSSIGGEIFPQVVTTATDLAARLGVDLPTATDMLGRALQNPQMGMRMLSTETGAFTKAQMDAIKAMDQAGDHAGAQKQILDILGARIGGLAKDDLGTLQGQWAHLQNIWQDTEQNLGQDMIPALEKLVSDVSGVSQSAADATDKNNALAKAFYQAVSGAEALVDWLKYAYEDLHLVGTMIGDLASVAVSAFHDMLGAVENWGEGLKNVGAAFMDVLKGDFKDALGELKKPIKMDFSESHSAIDTLVSDFQDGANKMLNTASSASADWAAAMDAKGFTPIKTAVDSVAQHLNKPATDETGMTGAALSQATKATDAMQKFADDLKTIEDKMNQDQDDFTSKSSDLYQNYSDKMASIQQQMDDLTASFQEAQAQRDQAFNDAQASAQDTFQAKQIKNYEDYTTKLADAQKKVQELMLKTANGPHDANLDTDLIDLKKAQDQVASYQKILNDNASWKAAATADLNTDEFTKAQQAYDKQLAQMQAKYDKEAATAQEAYDKKLAALTTAQEKEQEAYDKASNDLLAATDKKFADLANQEDKGWTAVEKVAGSHVATMSSLEAQAMALAAKLSAGPSMSAASNTIAVHDAIITPSGQVVQTDPQDYIIATKDPASLASPSSTSMEIHIMEGASVTLSGSGDINDLAATIAAQIARAIQGQRMGMATHI